MEAGLRVAVSVADFTQLTRKSGGASADIVWGSRGREARLAGGPVEAGRFEAR